MSNPKSQVEPLKTTSGPDPKTPLPVEAAYRKRIGDAIFKITEKLPTQFRSVVDGYFRHVSPKLCYHQDANFPKAVRRHPQNSDCSSMSEPSNLLYFSIGNAILTYYEAVLHLPVAVALENRTRLLEQIGVKGFDKFVVQGNDREGYHLIHKDEATVPFLKPGGKNDEHNTETA